jgi:hypothetical protein
LCGVRLATRPFVYGTVGYVKGVGEREGREGREVRGERGERRFPFPFPFSFPTFFFGVLQILKNGHCVRVITGHTGWVWCLLSVGENVWSGGGDKSVRIWTAEPGKDRILK